MLTLALTCAVAAGCTTARAIPPAAAQVPSPVPTVRVGDTAVVHTTAGRRERFVVDRIEGDTIVSTTGVRYARTVIVHVERRASRPLRTTFLVLGAFAIVAAAALTALD